MLHALNNTEITYYFNYEPKFNGVYSKKQITQNKRWSVINLDNKNNKGTHWVSLFIDKNTAL